MPAIPMNVIWLILFVIFVIAGTGAVKIQGKIWSARPRDENQVIDEGNKVKILDIQGVKVIVEKIEEKTGEE